MKKWILLSVLLLVVTGVAQAIPNPAAVYCILQGYEYEIRTDEQGNQYGVCVFPDGSECGAWDYYRKCELNGLGYWPGDFSCHWPCKEMRCKEAGEPVLVSRCCEGLDEIYPAHIFDDNCNELGLVGWLFLCSDCGNGICESWESKCNCPEDCAQPCIIYVDADANGLNNGSSWADAYRYLQNGLADANSGDEIWVAQGIYKPDQGGGITPGDRTATFQLINGVTIKGGYAGFGEPDPNARDIDTYETILSGDLDGNDIDVNDPADLLDEPTRAENSYHVVTGSGTDATAVLDGFEIISGNANIRQDRGGGMYNESGSPMIIQCSFSRNSASYGGALYNEESHPIMRGCVFTGNFAYSCGGGIRNRRGSNPSMLNCVFVGNLAGTWGGGIENVSDSNATLINCIFSGNSAEDYGGGMYNDARSGGCNPALINCIFNGNSADRGGGLCNEARSNAILINCIFSGNSADYGGGMFNYHSGIPIVINCTFSNNSAGKEGGGLYIPLPPVEAGGPSSKMGDGTCTITNCIFWENWPQQIVDLNLWGFSSISVEYSDVQGGWPGEGNIDTDPCFADAANGDYHLKSAGWRWDRQRKVWTWDEVTSLCIDAGNAGSLLGDEPLSLPIDIDNKWGENLRINMGAFGGTAEASMAPRGWSLLADLSNDGIVNFVDLALQVQDWLTTANEQPGDLNHDGAVNMIDFSILADTWLKRKPFVVKITKPENGANFYYYETIEIEAHAWYVSGSILKVEFFANGSKIGEDNDGTDGWKTNWEGDHASGSYNLTAKATNDNGATTVSLAVVIRIGGGGPP